MILRAVPRSKRRHAATAQPDLVGSPVATGGGTVLTTMSQPLVQRCLPDPVLGLLPGRCPSRPGAIDPRNTRTSDGARSKGFGGRRAPRSCSVNPHTIVVRGAPVPQPRAVRTAAISGASAVFRGSRPASFPTETTRDPGRLSLIETVRQQVLRENDPSHAGSFLWRVRMQLARVGPTTPKQAGDWLLRGRRHPLGDGDGTTVQIQSGALAGPIRLITSR
jgi:hypothetical protein